MMLAADLTTYYNRVRRHLDCPKDEQNRLLLGVNKQVIKSTLSTDSHLPPPLQRTHKGSIVSIF